MTGSGNVEDCSFRLTHKLPNQRSHDSDWTGKLVFYRSFGIREAAPAT
jgi:hypothetical protein